MSRDLTTLAKRLPLVDQLVRRPPGLYWNIRAKLAAEDRLDQDERAALQERALRDIVAQARRAPHYAGLAPGAGLADLALLDKQAVRAAPRSFMTGAPLGSRATTSGSTGIPLVLRRSPYSIVYEQATLDHVIGQSDIEPTRARSVSLKADRIKPHDDASPPFWTALTRDRLAMSTPHLNRQTWRDYVAKIHDFRPDILFAFTATLELLVSYMEEGGRRLAVPLCVTSCETAPPGLRRRVADRFGGLLLDIYGQAERVAFATAWEDGQYRFRPGYGIVEFEDGPLGTEIVGTGLRNRAQPLLRYCTGDVADLGGVADPARRRRIALGVETFEGVTGRTCEYLSRRDGSRIIGLNHMVRGVPGIASAQIVQTDFDVVEFLVVPGADYAETSLQMLRERIHACLPSGVSVSVQLVSEPRRTASGKAPLFITERRFQA